MFQRGNPEVELKEKVSRELSGNIATNLQIDVSQPLPKTRISKKYHIMSPLYFLLHFPTMVTSVFNFSPTVLHTHCSFQGRCAGGRGPSGTSAFSCCPQGSLSSAAPRSWNIWDISACIHKFSQSSGCLVYVVPNIWVDI